jgi:DNA-binding LacI/PurR family transcriptional regulator
VRRVAAELGYRPNRLARGLKRGQSPIFGILDFSILHPFYARVVREFEILARAQGFACVVCDNGLDESAESASLEFLLELPVHGVLLVGDRRRSAPVNERLAEVWRAGTPVAAISGAVPGTDVPRVAVDNQLVGQIATRHLREAGHARIAYVTVGLSDEESTAGYMAARWRAYQAELARQGLRPDPRLVMTMNALSRSEAERALDQLLSLTEPPTAVFASHDEVALTLIGAALGRGLRVPEDLATVGVDDLPIGSLVWPTLTTIAPPIDQMVALALEGLLHPEGTRGERLVEPALIVRGSSVAPTPERAGRRAPAPARAAAREDPPRRRPSRARG